MFLLSVRTHYPVEISRKKYITVDNDKPALSPFPAFVNLGTFMGG